MKTLEELKSAVAKANEEYQAALKRARSDRKDYLKNLLGVDSMSDEDLVLLREVLENETFKRRADDDE